MAKRSHASGFTKALLDVEAMEITEYDKDGNAFVYDLLAELREFHGKTVTLNVKEEFPIAEKQFSEDGDNEVAVDE